MRGHRVKEEWEMSDEEKVNAPGTVVRKAKKWPIVISVFAVAAIAVLVAFLHWHEEPTFCNAFCHQPMDRYVEGYYSDDVSMEAAVHEQNGVTCLGCHWTQAKMMDLVNEVVVWATDGFTDPLPDETGIASEEFCGKCHDGVTAPTKESATADWVYDPHNIPEDVTLHQTAGADGGAITCSDCHKAHKASTMMCAECHASYFTEDSGTIPEGWATPEVSVDVMSNHSTAVSSDSCATCHNDVKATSKETASAEAGYTLDFHNLTDDVKDMHASFVDNFGCETCHETNSVATCTACHADVFTEDNLPAGWTLADESAADDGSADSDAASIDVSAIADGTYEGTGKGIGGDVPVSVTVSGGAITAVEVGENGETQGIGSNAIEQLPDAIVAANGIDGVDAVSGATVTSNAIFDAVTEALSSAAA